MVLSVNGTLRKTLNERWPTTRFSNMKFICDISKCYFRRESGRRGNRDSKYRFLTQRLAVKRKEKKGWHFKKTEHKEEENNFVLIWRGMFLIKKYGNVWICICSEKELMKNKAQEERTVLDRRRNSIYLNKRKGYNGSRWREISAAGCDGISYLCPLFSPRSRRQAEIKSREEKTRLLGKIEMLKLSF